MDAEEIKNKEQLLNSWERRKLFLQKEMKIADRTMFLLSQELNCKEDCVYRDPKAKVAPYCRYGDEKVIIERNLCKSYVKEPV